MIQLVDHETSFSTTHIDPQVLVLSNPVHDDILWSQNLDIGDRTACAFAAFGEAPWRSMSR